MKTIKKNITNELIINKSRFITLLYKVDDEGQIKIILNELKKEYKDATHYCYGYIVGDIKRCSDDGEPSGTAGIQILSVLESNNLNLVLVVVIRYFGGIKLGAGGLIRAYRKSVNECLKLGQLVNLEKGIIIEVVFEYENTKNIDNILKDYEVIEKDYGEMVKYKVIVDKNVLQQLDNYTKIKDTFIEK